MTPNGADEEEPGVAGESPAVTPLPPAGPQVVGPAARALSRPGAGIRYAEGAYAGARAVDVVDAEVIDTEVIDAPAPPPEPARVQPESGLIAREDEAGSGPWVWISAILGLLILAIVGFLVFRLLAAGSTPPIQQVTIPRLVDLGYAQAEAEGKRLGLVVVRFAFEPSNKATDTVLKQDPAPGGNVDKGSVVRLTLALGAQTVTVPDLRGKSESAALNLIATAGLAIGKRSEANDPDIPLGSIVSQDPSPGQLVAKGLSVNYVVSRGPLPTATPIASPTPTAVPITPAPTRPPTPRQTATPTRAPTPTPDPTPDPTPVATPTPGPTPVATPTPTPGPTPVATPTPTPTGTPTPTPIPNPV